MKMSKQGSTESGLFDAFSLAISLLLQYGIPLEYLVDKFSYMRFEPSGWTKNPDIRQARSPIDYIFRWMSNVFLHKNVPVADDKNGENFIEEKIITNNDNHEVCKKCGHTPLIKTGTCYTCPQCGEAGGCG